mmetsp:Transcript_50355/g.64545  ORF Transcript_50355/g.64545 Transcript_50355/m.64545 type:complete len:439 (-) Transcript_50355:2091-3407(-)
MAQFGDTEALRLKFQRDLNCLADHDRMVRRKGMQRLRASLQDQKTLKLCSELIQNNNKETLEVFFVRYLRDILVRSFSDEVEFCRECSFKLVYMFATDILSKAELGALAEVCIPILVEKVGVSPPLETTEEIRLLAMQLVDLFIVDSNILTKVLKSNDKLGEGITTILTRSLGDLYPEVKRLCSMAVRHLVANFPVLAITHGVDLMKSSVLNLGHQHAKTRQLTIQALGQLILCCAGAAGGNGVPNSSSTSALQGDLAVASSAAEADLAVMSDELAMMSDGATLLENPSNEAALATCLKDIVVPAFHKVVEDSSASVRLTLARCHGFLLRAKPLKTLGLAHLGLEAPFLTQLLVLTRDVADEVQRVSFEALQQASNHWAEHTPGWDHGSALSSELPPRALFVCSAEVLPVEEAVYSSIVRPPPHPHTHNQSKKSLSSF